MRLTHRKPALTHLRTGIRHLFPGYFALVMATGIISVAVGSGGAADLSAAMLVQGIVCYLVLIACYIWRFASYRPEFVADATGPRTAFSLFTSRPRRTCWAADWQAAAVGHDGTWVAFAVWAVLFAAMLASFAGLIRGYPATGQRCP